MGLPLWAAPTLLARPMSSGYPPAWSSGWYAAEKRGVPCRTATAGALWTLALVLRGGGDICRGDGDGGMGMRELSSPRALRAAARLLSETSLPACMCQRSGMSSDLSLHGRGGGGGADIYKKTRRQPKEKGGVDGRTD